MTRCSGFAAQACAGRTAGAFARRTAWWLIAFAAGLAGCAAPPAVVNPAWFRPMADVAEPKLPGSATLVVPPQVAATPCRTVRPLAGEAPTPSRPIGRIAQQALRQALEAAFRDGVTVQDAPPADRTDPATVLLIDAVACRDRTQILWVLPVPVLGLVGDHLTEVQVQLDVRALDEHGTLRWQRRFDSGWVTWKPPRPLSEAVDVGLTRMAHELAWQLARQAVDDLRMQMREERARRREL